MTARTQLLDDRAIGRALVRMASEIVERCGGTTDVVLVGIQRRGVELAQRLKRLIDAAEKTDLPTGKLDITLYRDDLQTIGPRPVVGETSLPDLEGRTTSSTPAAPSALRSTKSPTSGGRGGCCCACSSTGAGVNCRSRPT